MNMRLGGLQATGKEKMKIGYHKLLLVLLLTCVATSCEEQPTEQVSVCDPTARTYYEALNLVSPESAVAAFADAFGRGDFLSVWLILSPNAQFRWQAYMATLDRERLYCRERKGDAMEGLFSDGPLWYEHIGTWYVFDQVMLAAQADSALLIDLGGNVTIERSEDSETIDGAQAVDVIAQMEGIQGEVIFRTVQAASGRWRVHQVIVPGGDEELVPWAVVNETIETIRIEAVAGIEVPCSDNPPSAPEQVPGQPYLLAEPTCGTLSRVNEEHQVEVGTTLTLTGQGFTPNTETKIWWEDHVGNEFIARQAGEYVLFQTDDQGSFQVSLEMPYAIAPMGEESHTWIIRAVQEVPVTGP